MRINNLIIIALVLIGSQYPANAQDSEEIFTIYLIRHAEKELSADNPKDPPLTACGQQRAESLARFLTAVDLDVIYSTDYLRTKNTALPIATTKGLELQIYNPRELSDFAKALRDQKQNAVVIGHSNTTSTLAGLLIGDELAAIDESIYHRIYQVVISKDNGRLHLLQSAFSCVD